MEKPEVRQELEEGLCSRIMEKKMMYQKYERMSE